MTRLYLPQFLLLVFVLASVQLAHAKTFSYKHFSVENGLPSSTVYDCIQDNDGFMWFATENGVVRFDGYEFEVFEEGLPNEGVIFLCKDVNGRIWFGSENQELSYFENNFVVPFEHNDKIKKVNFHYFRDISTINSGVIQLISCYSGSFLVAQNGQVTKELDKNQFYINHTKTNTIGFCNITEPNKFEYTLDYTDENNVSTIIKIPEIETKSTDIRSCFDTISSTLYFSIHNHLFKYSNNGIILISIFDSEIWDMEFINGSIWLNFVYNGVSIINPRDNQLTSLEGMEELSIYDIYQDKDNGVWIITYGDGIYYLPSPNIHTLTKKDGLSSNTVGYSVGTSETLVTTDLTGSINWLNFSSDSIVVIDNYDHIPHYDIIFHPFNNDFLILRKSVTTKLSEGAEELIYDKRIGLTAAVAKDHLISFHEQKNGLNLTHYRNDLEQSHIIKIRHPINISDLRCIYYGGGNNIYIGLTNGLVSFPISEKNIPDSLSYWSDKHKLYGATIMDIKGSSKYNLILGTRRKGLIISNSKHPYNLSKRDGLISNQIRTLFIDSSETIWVGTPEGLSIIDTNFNIVNIRKEDGLISNQINSIFVSNKKAYIGTNKGLTVLDKSLIKKDSIDIPIILKSITLENNEKITPNGNTINIGYNPPVLKINYVGISYKSMGRIQYRYRLNETENWQYTNGTELLFNNMGSGEYRLEIQASNGESPWSSEPGILYINVAYPFWRTWTFIIVSSLLFIGVAILIFRFALRRVQRRADLKEQIQTLRFEALNAQMNPHFMFNSLNSIQNFIMQNEKKASVRYLSKFAKLMRLTLNHSQRKHIFLEEELKSLELYLTLEMLRFDHQFDYELIIENNVDQQSTLIPALLIQPIVENAILHGIRPLKSNGHIEIRLSKVSNQLMIEVKDNGVGRNLKKINENEKKADGHQSKGSLMTEERIALFAREFKGEYDYKIIDLKSDKISYGTKIVLSIPYILKTN